MSNFINIPEYILENIDLNKISKLDKLKLLIKGKLLSLIINRSKGKIFCFLINLLYLDKNKIGYENSKYYFDDGKKKLFYYNDRILRVAFGAGELFGSLIDDYCLDSIEINKGETVVDCGANIGEFYYSISKLQTNFNYIAFEPEPNNFHCLDLNLNEKNNTTLYKYGLSEVNGTSEFFLSEDGSDSSFINSGLNNSIELETRTLDSFNLDKIKLLKIEAEGFEPEVLKGALDTIKKTEYISIDSGPERGPMGETTLTQVTNILYENGYQLIKFNDRRCIGLFQNRLLLENSK